LLLFLLLSLLRAQLRLVVGFRFLLPFCHRHDLVGSETNNVRTRHQTVLARATYPNGPRSEIPGPPRSTRSVLRIDRLATRVATFLAGHANPVRTLLLVDPLSEGARTGRVGIAAAQCRRGDAERNADE